MRQSPDYSETRRFSRNAGLTIRRRVPILFERWRGRPLTAKTVLIADDTALRARPVPGAPSKMPATAPIVARSAVELLAPCAPTSSASTSSSLDLRLPNASGVDLVRAIRKIDERPPADSRVQRHHCQRRRGARARGARRRRLHQRVQRGAAHPAVAGAAPVSRQLQPSRQPARRAGHPGRLPVRQHHRHGAHAQPQSRRHRHPHDEPARARAPRRASDSACRRHAARSTSSRGSPGATAASAWACSSRASIRPTRRPSTSSSTPTSSTTGGPEPLASPAEARVLESPPGARGCSTRSHLAMGLLAILRPGLRQRILRRGRVRAGHGAEDAHRPADRRGHRRRPHGAAGARTTRTATSPRRSSGSPWPASASGWVGEPALAALDRAAASASSAEYIAAVTAHSIAVVDLVRDHHRAAHRPGRAGAEDRRAAARRARSRCWSRGRREIFMRVFWPFIALLNALGTMRGPRRGPEAAERPLAGALGGRAEDARDGEPGGGRPRRGRRADAPPRLRLRRPHGGPGDGAADRDDGAAASTRPLPQSSTRWSPRRPRAAAGVRQGPRRHPAACCTSTDLFSRRWRPAAADVHRAVLPRRVHGARDDEGRRSALGDASAAHASGHRHRRVRRHGRHWSRSQA